jgi:hypothetical protein
MGNEMIGRTLKGFVICRNRLFEPTRIAEGMA